MEAEPEVSMRGGGAIGDWYVLLFPPEWLNSGGQMLLFFAPLVKFAY